MRSPSVSRPATLLTNLLTVPKTGTFVSVSLFAAFFTLREIALRFGDPIIEYTFCGSLLRIPLSHNLPLIRRKTTRASAICSRYFSLSSRTNAVIALTFGFEEGVAMEPVCPAISTDTIRITASASCFTQVLQMRDGRAVCGLNLQSEWFYGVQRVTIVGALDPSQAVDYAHDRYFDLIGHDSAGLVGRHEAASAADAFACSKETIWQVPDFPDRRGLRKDRFCATMTRP